jgi:hypothetical protein
MLKQYIKGNNESRVRLSKLAEGISDKELKLVIYKEGWTVAAMLAHVAFWDERRAWNMKEWKDNGMSESGLNELDTRIINDTLVPFFLALPPRKAAELAVTCAEHVDKEIEGLTPELVSKIEALGDKYALDRGLHRKMHLDEIDVFLKEKRGKA